MKQIFTLLIAIAAAFTVNAQTVGQEAPDFTLNDLGSQSYTLSANRGKAILVFFVGYNCPNCLASAPTVKSDVVDVFKSDANFEALVIDVWDGNKSSVEGFKNQTNLAATYLQQGSGVASSWGMTYDRLAVIDEEGKLVFKGTRAARSDVSGAKAAIQAVLNDLNTTSVGEIDEAELNVLEQNYPNPVTGNTRINFRLNKTSEVNLSVFDISGKQLDVLVSSNLPAGEHQVEWDSTPYNQGVYLYRIETPEFRSTRRMVVK